MVCFDFSRRASTRGWLPTGRSTTGSAGRSSEGPSPEPVEPEGRLHCIRPPIRPHVRPPIISDSEAVVVDGIPNLQIFANILLLYWIWGS